MEVNMKKRIEFKSDEEFDKYCEKVRERELRLNSLEEHLPVSNETRLDKLANLTRGLELPKNSTALARVNFYTARDNYVKQAIALNYTDKEICVALGIPGKILSTIKTRIFQDEIKTLDSMTQKEHFVEYKLKQYEVIKDLDVLIEKHRVGNNLVGLQAALKQKSDVLKELKACAQEIGIMKKRAEEVKVIEGYNVKELSNDDIVNKIKHQNKLLGKLLNDGNEVTLQQQTTTKTVKLKKLKKKD